MRASAACYGGVSVRELEEMPFARYERVLTIADKMARERQERHEQQWEGGESDG